MGWCISYGDEGGDIVGYARTNGVEISGVGGSARAHVAEPVGGGATVKEEATEDDPVAHVQWDDWSGGLGMG